MASAQGSNSGSVLQLPLGSNGKANFCLAQWLVHWIPVTDPEFDPGRKLVFPIPYSTIVSHRSDGYVHVCVHSDGIEPVYTLKREPVTGELPQFMVMEVQLPGIVSDLLFYSSH